MKHIMDKKHFGVTMLALVLTLTLSLGGIALAADGSATISDEEIDAIINTTTDAAQVESPFISVANSVRGSVVGINNYQVSRSNNYYYYGFGFGFGNDGRDNGGERLYGTGSGVAVSAYGHVLTNYHVVDGANRITVTVEGEDKEYDATLVSFDEDQDIAVLLVKDLPVAPVTLGDSDALQVGEWAIVIGNPLSETFARTVTVGVVSALDRKITDTSYDMYGRRTKITNNMIQVDAAINSGNSGGGMFNTLGQLMGIPARKYSGNMFSGASIDNIGMCIPVNVAKPLIKDALQKYGTDTGVNNGIRSATNNTDRPMLGVTVTTVNSNGILPNGALVMEVNDNSNASRAGILKGDVIVSVDDTVISSSSQLVSTIQKYAEGDTMTVKIYRAPGMEQAIQEDRIDLSEVGEGDYITVTVTLRGAAAA